MMKKMKKKTLFLIGLLGLSIVGIFQNFTKSNGNETLSKAELRSILQTGVSTANADYGPCDSAGGCDAGTGGGDGAPSGGPSDGSGPGGSGGPSDGW